MSNANRANLARRRAAAAFPGVMSGSWGNAGSSIALQRELAECGQGLADMLQGKMAAEQRAASWELKHRALMARYVALKQKTDRSAELNRLRTGKGRVSNRVAALERRKKSAS